MTIRSVVTHSEAETVAVGRRLGASLGPDTVVVLSGDLGAGKTAFVRGIAEGLGAPASEVTSPTFTLIQEYRGGRLSLAHVDLYRLKPNEVDDLGLDELSGSGGVMAIEWPDRLPRAFQDAIRVQIDHADGMTRMIQIEQPTVHSPQP